MADEDAIIAAVRANDAAQVRAVLARNPLVFRLRTPEGTLLLTARRHGAEDALRAVLERTPEDQLNLYEAAAVGNERRLKTILGQSRTRVNAPSPGGDTALGLAAAAGHLEAVKVLLDHGADPNPAGAGAGPVELALRSNHAGIAAVLRAAGSREPASR